MRIPHQYHPRAEVQFEMRMKQILIQLHPFFPYANNILSELVAGNNLEIIYEAGKPWFWKVFLSNSPRPSEAPRPSETPRPHTGPKVTIVNKSSESSTTVIEGTTA